MLVIDGGVESNAVGKKRIRKRNPTALPPREEPGIRDSVGAAGFKTPPTIKKIKGFLTEALTFLKRRESLDLRDRDGENLAIYSNGINT